MEQKFIKDINNIKEFKNDLNNICLKLTEACKKETERMQKGMGDLKRQAILAILSLVAIHLCIKVLDYERDKYPLL